MEPDPITPEQVKELQTEINKHLKLPVKTYLDAVCRVVLIAAGMVLSNTRTK